MQNTYGTITRPFYKKKVLKLVGSFHGNLPCEHLFFNELFLISFKALTTCFLPEFLHSLKTTYTHTCSTVVFTIYWVLSVLNLNCKSVLNPSAMIRIVFFCFIICLSVWMKFLCFWACLSHGDFKVARGSSTQACCKASIEWPFPGKCLQANLLTLKLDPLHFNDFMIKRAVSTYGAICSF